MSGPRSGPRDLDLSTQKARFELPPEDLSIFVLEATEGPDAGSSWPVDESQPLPLLVGQSPVCAVQLRDRQVSRRHVSFEIVDRKLLVRDLDSTNGTRVDGVAIVAAWIRAGQTIRLGSTALRVARKEGAGAASAASSRAAVVALASHTSFGRVRGTSLAMRRIFPVLARLAASNVPVILEGETGTGKELVAEALHENGPRAAGPFVVFDCAGTPSAALESALLAAFGQANGGTLLLEQISALDPAFQPKLLHAIERSKVDARIVVTTTVDLDAEVQVGRLREDLYHRLAVARVELPALRTRREDIDDLALHFATELGAREALSDDVLSRWRAGSWPGNVRELRNAVANRIALGDLADPIAPASARTQAVGMPLSTLVDEAVAAGTQLAVARQRVITMFEELYVEGVLEKHEGHVLRAANAAGVARRYFQVLKARLGK